MLFICAYAPTVTAEVEEVKDVFYEELDLVLRSAIARNKLGTAAAHLQEYIYTLEEWLQTKRLKVSPTKSTLTLVTPWNKECATQPTVTLNNTPIPYTNTPTTLGVTYERDMTFGHHTDNINTKTKTRLNVLRALTNTSFGHSKCCGGVSVGNGYTLFSK